MVNNKQPLNVASSVHSAKKGRAIWVIFGTLLLFSVIFGAAFAPWAAPEQPCAVAADSQATTVTIPIEGMTCAACVARVKKTLQSIEGVTEVTVSLAQRAARVSYLEAQVSPERVTAAINDLGYKAGAPTAERTQ